MSSPPPASNYTSPGPSVRSSKAAAHTQYASSRASTAEPEAITPPETTHLNGSLPLCDSSSGSCTEQKLLEQNLNGKGDDDKRDDSNSNTPRLPFAQTGNHDLESMPAEDRTPLDPVNHISHTQSSSPHPSLKLSTISSGSSNQTALTENTRKANSSPIITMSSKNEPQDEVIHDSTHDQSSHLAGINDGPYSSSNLPPQSQHVRTEPKGQTLFLETETQADFVRPPKLQARKSDPSKTTRDDAFREDKDRSSSRSSQSRVEKRIEATLAEAAPATNARSRKSSHMLGLFKENTVPQGRKNSQNVKSPPAILEADDPIANHMETRHGSDGIHDSNSAIVDEEGADSGDQFLRTPSALNAQRQISHENSEASLPAQEHVFYGNTTEGAQVNEPENGSRKENISKKKLPTRLLEEIREHHNLGTPFHNKFRTTQPKPKDQDTGLRLEPEPSIEHDATITSRETEYQAPETEEDDSDKEQISSALYYPHEAPSPDALKDVDISETRRQKDSEQEPSTRLPEAAIIPRRDPETPSSDVDINLQSHNRSRHLHGDLKQVRPSSRDLDYSKLFEASPPASESEPESVGYSSLTDDAELTPRASPTSRASFLEHKSRKARPAAPLGAVELKPYNHQVGGHTTVFRFSKRAVCKQLTSRENRFYELIEKHHPELLKFLPRYAGYPNHSMHVFDNPLASLSQKKFVG